MFGLERIGWLVFFLVILIVLIVWYLTLFIAYWWKQSCQSPSKSFETDLEEAPTNTEINTFHSDVPKLFGYISPIQVSGMPLAAESQADFEMGEGISLEHLLEGKTMASQVLHQRSQFLQ